MVSRVAGLKERFAAVFVDFLIIAAYIAALALVSSLVNRATSFAQRLQSAGAADLLAFISLVLPVVLYFALQEGSSRQATIGKRKMGLVVIDSRGGRLGWGRALLRSGLKFLPWQMAHTAVFQIRYGNASMSLVSLSIAAQFVVLAYLLTLLLDKQRRTPYDRLTGSRVVRATPRENSR